MTHKPDFVVKGDEALNPLLSFLKRSHFNCYSKRDYCESVIVQIGNEYGRRYQPEKSILIVAPYPVKTVEDMVRARLGWEPNI